MKFRFNSMDVFATQFVGGSSTDYAFEDPASRHRVLEDLRVDLTMYDEANTGDWKQQVLSVRLPGRKTINLAAGDYLVRIPDTDILFAMPLDAFKAMFAGETAEPAPADYSFVAVRAGHRFVAVRQDTDYAYAMSATLTKKQAIDRARRDVEKSGARKSTVCEIVTSFERRYQSVEVPLDNGMDGSVGDKEG